MFNRNVFLTGLGTGLIAGALLLQLMLSVAPDKSGKPGPAASPEWDPDAFKTLAEQHNYAVYPKSDKLYTEVQLNDKVKQMQQQQATGNPTTGSAPSVPADVLIYISEGNTSKEVADLLAKAGIIKDAAAFEEKVRSLGVDTKLNRGAFSLTPGMSEDDLLARLVIPSR